MAPSMTGSTEARSYRGEERMLTRRATTTQALGRTRVKQWMAGWLCAGVALGINLAPARGVTPPAQDQVQPVEPGSKAASRKPGRDRGKALESPRARKLGGPAIGGFCPVSYFRDGKAALGKEEFKLTHLGETYYFADEDARSLFEKDPERYVPRLSGWCMLTLGGQYGNRLEGDPEVFRIIDGKLYLFLSERAMRAFDAAPAGVVGMAEERFAQPMLQGNCPVSYFTKGEPVAGSKEYRVAYGRRVLQFSDAKAREMFLSAPEKYMPQYQGYCAVSLVDRNKLFADPSQFRIAKDKLYLFLSAEKKAWFDEHAEAVIEAANQVWALIRDEY